MDIVTAQLPLQLALGVGFFSYVLASMGFRQLHTPIDALFYTALYAAGCSGILSVGLTFAWDPFATYGLAVLIPILFGLFWRAKGRSWAIWLLRVIHAHDDDGLTSLWTAIHQHPQFLPAELEVRTKDGWSYRQESTYVHHDAFLFGSHYGTDGSILMVPDYYKTPGDADWTATKDVVHHQYGTKQVFIAAENIACFSFRNET